MGAQTKENSIEGIPGGSGFPGNESPSTNPPPLKALLSFFLFGIVITILTQHKWSHLEIKL